MLTKYDYSKQLEKREKKKEKSWDAVTWIKSHPEDIPLARENLAARDHYDDDALKNLMAAISLRACTDYKLATNGVRTDHADPRVTLEECHEFFNGDIFQYFINRIRISEVEKAIRSTPDGMLSSMVKNLGK